jgi:hypothetical protein
MVRGTGVAVIPDGRLVGVITNGGGLTLGVGKMTEGTAPSRRVVMISLEKLMRSVVTGGMDRTVVMVVAVYQLVTLPPVVPVVHHPNSSEVVHWLKEIVVGLIKVLGGKTNTHGGAHCAVGTPQTAGSRVTV